MYHSVVPRNKLWSRISDPLDQFEEVLLNLAEAGFNTILLDDLYEYLSRNKPLPEKPIALTFDDGYLDNWLYVFPLLKKYNMKATLFPSLEFIGDGEPRLLSGTGGQLHEIGYLNWAELKLMQNSGHFDIQSHTMTHTWLFSSPDVTGFLKPEEPYNWIEWNRNKPIKTDWHPGKVLPGLVPGSPIFKYGRALGVREFIPDEKFVRKFEDMVSKCGGVSYLETDHSKKELDSLLAQTPLDKRGRFESDVDFQNRVDYELGDSRSILSSALGKPVNFLCWPGGGWHPFIGQRWKQYGYLATSLPSTRSYRRTNLPGDSMDSFARISSGLGEWRFRGRTAGRLDSKYFGFMLDHYLGNPGSLLKMRRTKVRLLIRKLLNRSGGRNV